MCGVELADVLAHEDLIKRETQLANDRDADGHSWPPSGWYGAADPPVRVREQVLAPTATDAYREVAGIAVP